MVPAMTLNQPQLNNTTGLFSRGSWQSDEDIERRLFDWRTSRALRESNLMTADDYDRLQDHPRHSSRI